MKYRQPWFCKFTRFRHAWLGLLLIAVGCARPGAIGNWTSPAPVAPAVLVAPWEGQPAPARVLVSEHYHIYTTIADDPTCASIARVMEGAHQQYRQLMPQLAVDPRPMECYFFASRSQWERFTQKHTGRDADIYLRIVRGGYTVGDRFVAYHLGDGGTASVAAHEGWHQFVARHFKGRLPPFLEEGIACLFEQVRWSEESPLWNWSVNANRLLSLREAMRHRDLWPLDQLIRLHAGMVINRPKEQVESFYAQNWAFARFLWEADGGKYRPAFQRLLADTAAGTVYDPTGIHRRNTGPWDPRGVRPMLEHYLQMDLPTLERRYRLFLHELAVEG